MKPFAKIGHWDVRDNLPRDILHQSPGITVPALLWRAPMNHRAIGRFRLIALLEGSSFLVLLGIAMPLKYLADMPMAVRAVGMIHGVLFIAYSLLVLGFMVRKDWALERAANAMLWAVVPFGTFFLDRELRDELAKIAQGASGK